MVRTGGSASVVAQRTSQGGKAPVCPFGSSRLAALRDVAKRLTYSHVAGADQDLIVDRSRIRSEHALYAAHPEPRIQVGEVDRLITDDGVATVVDTAQAA